MAIKKTVITKYTTLKKAYDAGAITLEDVRATRLDHLKNWETGSTATRIYSYMPPGKQTNWREYMKLHEAVLRGETLTPLDQAFYDTFPGHNESHKKAYDKCVKVFQWVIQCIAANNEKEKLIENATTADEILAVLDPEYPPWPLNR